MSDTTANQEPTAAVPAWLSADGIIRAGYISGVQGSRRITDAAGFAYREVEGGWATLDSPADEPPIVYAADCVDISQAKDLSR